ncbi:hypothetical protein B296_00012059 [Ensete ventricosum]|uniref:Uncharacterized protein n=1 Tax=Ensete ventricosum TaxID=4639 RepID=A0A427AVW5_ENSVE|nr:hypothetical protein B296_00012059 [Ensete ventricosum]
MLPRSPTHLGPLCDFMWDPLVGPRTLEGGGSDILLGRGRRPTAEPRARDLSNAWRPRDLREPFDCLYLVPTAGISPQST